MRVIWTAVIIFVECCAVIGAWRSAKKEDKGKAFRRAAGLTIAMSIGNVLVNLFGMDLPTPLCKASPGYDGICFESQELGVGIEYSLATGDADDLDWITYHEGNVVPIEKDPTTVRFRACYIFKRGDIQSETAHIDPYGRVYTTIESPITFKSIVAEYKLRKAEPGKAGNAFDGYTPKAEDFNVRGIDVNGDEVPIDGFTFQPDKLSFGKNEISIRYTTNTKQSLQDTVVVQANYPALISMGISLNDDLNGRVLPGTVLTPDMFSVEGTYEDGRTEALDAFEITPTEFEAEGTYLVTVSKGGITADTEIIVTRQIPVTGSEDEPNDELSQATRINANARYSGHISDYDDVDYYRLAIARKGKVWSKHPPA